MPTIRPSVRRAASRVANDRRRPAGCAARTDPTAGGIAARCAGGARRCPPRSRPWRICTCVSNVKGTPFSSARSRCRSDRSRYPRPAGCDRRRSGSARCGRTRPSASAPNGVASNNTISSLRRNRSSPGGGRLLQRRIEKPSGHRPQGATYTLPAGVPARLQFQRHNIVGRPTNASTVRRSPPAAANR